MNIPGTRNIIKISLYIMKYTWYKLLSIIPLNELHFDLICTCYIESVAGFQVYFLYSLFRAISL